jgi:hypothetical protein
MVLPTFHVGSLNCSFKCVQYNAPHALTVFPLRAVVLLMLVVTVLQYGSCYGSKLLTVGKICKSQRTPATEETTALCTWSAQISGIT